MTFMQFQKNPTFWEFVSAVSRNECILRDLFFAIHSKSVYFNLTLINDTKVIFSVELCSKISHSFDRSYVTQALFQTIVGCDYCTQSSSLNFEKYVFIGNGQKMCPKNMHPFPQYRIGPVTYSVTEKILSFDHLINQKWMTGISKSTFLCL